MITGKRVEFAYAGKPDSAGNVKIERRSESIGYTPAILVKEKAVLVELQNALVLVLNEALAWEEATRARLGLPQIDAPEWAVGGRVVIRLAEMLAKLEHRP